MSSADRATRASGGGRAQRARWSLAVRLMVWFVVSAFALVVIVTGSLYWALVSSLAQAEDEILLNKVHVLHGLLAAPHPDETVIAQEIGEDANAPRRTYVRVLSLAGAVLYETPGMAAELPPRSFPAAIAASEGVKGMLHGVDERPFRIRSAPLGIARPRSSADVVVEAAVDVSSDEKLLARYRTDLAVVLTTALLVCAAAGYQIVQAGLRPLDRIARAAEAISASTLNRRLDAGRLPAELRRLATTFNAMLERLDESFSRLGQFSDDIAHELRTPINRLLIANEVALGQTRTVDEYRDVLASNIDSCARLSQMVQSLLFLARSESPQSRINRETIDLGRELSAIGEFYEPLAGEAGITLSTACEAGLTADVDRSLLQRAVGNLIANAIAHTPSGGSIRVVGRDAGTSLSIEVADTGDGIAADHLPHVFDRFYRVNQNRSTAGGNLGLGLAIVKSVAALHGGSVEIESALAAGTAVKVHLPKAGHVPPPR
jgi:two-component system heavy metal sensor histidine kinase CusS